MYKYNSLLIYIIKLERNLRLKIKNQVINLIQNLLRALDVGRLQVDYCTGLFVSSEYRYQCHVIFIVAYGQL